MRGVEDPQHPALLCASNRGEEAGQAVEQHVAAEFGLVATERRLEQALGNRRFATFWEAFQDVYPSSAGLSANPQLVGVAGFVI